MRKNKPPIGGSIRLHVSSILNVVIKTIFKPFLFYEKILNTRESIKMQKSDFHPFLCAKKLLPLLFFCLLIFVMLVVFGRICVFVRSKSFVKNYLGLKTVLITSFTIVLLWSQRGLSNCRKSIKISKWSKRKHKLQVNRSILGYFSMLLRKRVNLTEG